MGYTKLVQYGNVTELYQYDKPLPAKPLYDGIPKKQNQLKKKRSKEFRDNQKLFGIYEQSTRSRNRTLKNFFRLCHHNNVYSDTIHFITLTFEHDISYKEATTHLERFMAKLSKASSPVPIRYISVPEYTKKNRIHLHLLVYDLPSRVSGEPVWSKKKQRFTHTTERDTRFLQSLYGRGFLDICPATYTSRGIAGYMSKYMAKSFGDRRITTTRNYNCSRNIKKITSAGSNSFDKELLSMFIHTTDLVEQDVQLYNVPYMGDCLKTSIVKIINK